jgi:hypothetical protein
MLRLIMRRTRRKRMPVVLLVALASLLCTAGKGGKKIDVVYATLEGVQAMQGQFEQWKQAPEAGEEPAKVDGYFKAGRDGRFLYVLGDPPGTVVTKKEGVLKVWHPGQDSDKADSTEIDPVTKSIVMVLSAFTAKDVKASFKAKLYSCSCCGEAKTLMLRPRDKSVKKVVKKVEVLIGGHVGEKPVFKMLVVREKSGVETWLDVSGMWFDDSIEDPLFED